jgi:hypothetical protein
MEKITPSNELFRLESEIRSKNADALRELVEHSTLTATEHIRRAAALYQLSMEMYEKGGDIHSVSEDGIAIIPLFDTDTKDTDERTRLSVNVNVETANLFQSLGINDDDLNTTVLDNVINHYSEASARLRKGYKIIIQNPSGIQNELMFL